MPMELPLPKKINSTEKMVLTDARQVTVIGTNGSGKTRFCNQMMKLCGDKAFRLCAMRAMFPDTSAEVLPGSISDIFNKLNE